MKLKYIILICSVFLICLFISQPSVISQIKFNNNIFNTPQSLSTSQNNGDRNLNRENILIILDASGSMNEKIGDEKKIDIAKKSIINVLNQVPEPTKIGLRVYGHTIDFWGIKACEASELKVPIMANSKDNICNQLSSIKPTGATPITYSIQQALAYDFIGLQGPKRIILVTDGMETCGQSPCDFSIELMKQGIDLKIDVIGFDIEEKSSLPQLKCTALATKGKFYTANNSSELVKSLGKTLNIEEKVSGQIIQTNKQ